GRGDGGNAARRDRDSDRRHPAEDARRAQGARRRLPGARRWGQRARGEALRARASDHPCGEFSTGVASAGNAAPEVLVRLSFRQNRNCRKVRSFHLRQLLPRWRTFVISRLVTAAPVNLRQATNEQAERTPHLRRLLLPSRRALRTPDRLSLSHVPPAQSRLPRPAATAPSRATAAPRGCLTDSDRLSDQRRQAPNTLADLAG